MSLHVDPTRDIGRSIVATGLFDLAVSEALVRLVPPAGTLVDAGANIGYMTLLGAMAAGTGGTVHAFEPHPGLFGQLARNVRDAPGASRLATVTLHNVALGAETGDARLLLPAGFDDNDGIARIVVDPGAADRTVVVPMRRLDDVVGDLMVDVLKMDVEGHEPHVLAGAARLLRHQRIRHVVFEDHDVTHSPAVRVLREAGYALFALGWTVRRLRLEPLSSAGLARSYEAPNFVATLDERGLHEACAAKGWRTLRPWLGRR